MSTEKDVQHQSYSHANMRIIEKVESEQLLIVMKGKDKLNIERKCFIKATICSNVYRKLETRKAAGIMGL